jgi:hypothetical protein
LFKDEKERKQLIKHCKLMMLQYHQEDQADLLWKALTGSSQQNLVSPAG